MTQRQNPSLTHLKVEIWRPDPELKDYSEKDEIVQSGGCLIVSFNYAPPFTSIGNIWSTILAKAKARNLTAVPRWTFRLPMDPSIEQINDRGYQHETVRVWRDEVAALDMTNEIPKNVLHILQSFLFEDARRRSPSSYARLRGTPPALRLFRVDNSFKRAVYKCAPTQAQLGYQAHTGYQDSVRRRFS